MEYFINSSPFEIGFHLLSSSSLVIIQLFCNVKIILDNILVYVYQNIVLRLWLPGLSTAFSYLSQINIGSHEHNEPWLNSFFEELFVNLDVKLLHHLKLLFGFLIQHMHGYSKLINA